MPDGGRAGLYTNWLNHGDRGPPRWETFHTRELPHLLERELRAEQPFAIAGLSMGGLGAINYAARHPDMFSAAASYSGILNPRSNTDIVFGLLRSEDVDPLAPWGNPVRDAAIWRAHDPIELAPRLRSTALFVSAGNGDSGPLDPPGAGFDELEAALRTQAEAFVSHLRGLEIAPHADFYDRWTHTWPYWRRELRRSLPILLGQASPMHHKQGSTSGG
jgi:S-formylglutathione hydrolase FrmB